MGTQSNQFYDVSLFVNPDQQEITFDVAFQTAFVFADQRMRHIFIWDWQLVNQQVEQLLQFREQLGLVPVALQVFLELGGGL